MSNTQTEAGYLIGVAADASAKAAAEVPRLDGPANELARTARRAVGNLTAKARELANRADEAARDNRYPPEERRERVASIGAQLDEAVRDQLDQAADATTVLLAHLESSALPAPKSEDAAMARADADMLLGSASSSPTARIARLSELARRDDAVGALVRSPWGLDWLAGPGGQDHRSAAAAHKAALLGALEAATRSGDAGRRQAAESHFAVSRSLSKARDAAAIGADQAGRLIGTLAEQAGFDRRDQEISRLRDIAERQRAELGRLRG